MNDDLSATRFLIHLQASLSLTLTYLSSVEKFSEPLYSEPSYPKLSWPSSLEEADHHSVIEFVALLLVHVHHDDVDSKIVPGQR